MDINRPIDAVVEAESFLCDIFLSGFHSISHSTIQKADFLIESFKSLGMSEAVSLLENLRCELNKRVNSFSYDLCKLTSSYCFFEFYIICAKEKLE